MPGSVDMLSYSVSESQVEKVKTYIKAQEEHHRKRTFKEEIIALLAKNNVAFDEKYMFE